MSEQSDEFFKEAEASARRAWRRRYVELIVLGGSLAVATGLLFTTFQDRRRLLAENDMREMDRRQEMMRLADTVRQLQDEISHTQQLLRRPPPQSTAKPSKRPPPVQNGATPEQKQALDQLTTAQTQLATRMAALESSLSNTPEKALALPLLKQQLTDTQERFKSEMDEAHAEFGRLYTLVQWALGLIVTIILGLGGFLIGKGKEPPAPTAAATVAATQALRDENAPGVVK